MVDDLMWRHRLRGKELAECIDSDYVFPGAGESGHLGDFSYPGLHR
jgi:hypothetical protein